MPPMDPVLSISLKTNHSYCVPEKLVNIKWCNPKFVIARKNPIKAKGIAKMVCENLMSDK
jgi:hypothetical protein